MSFEKVRDLQVFGVSNQNSSVRLPVGTSISGTHTSVANPMRGTLLWDHCAYVLTGVSVAGGATGGSYTVTVETDAVFGYTGLPIARVTGIGPNSVKVIVMTNLHNSSGSPMPTHLQITQTAAGGGLWATCRLLAKQYRGTLGTPGAKTSERIIQGTMLRGNSAGGQFGSDAGVSADTTFTLGTTGSALGMHRMRAWDRAFYWFVAAGNTLSGTHDMTVVGRIGISGTTFPIATTGAAGALTAAGGKVAIASNMGGASAIPQLLIWDVVSAGGVSDGRVVVLAKSGRGSMAKQ